ELEVMRDRADNCVVVCSIENFDPMGVHTGDSITVAPAQTLTDRCYQEMRDAAFTVIRTIKVEAGGSNIQFAVHPEPGNTRAIGRIFPEALLKGMRALETGADQLPGPATPRELERLKESLAEPSPARLRDLFRALASGESPESLSSISGVDSWFLRQMKRVSE